MPGRGHRFTVEDDCIAKKIARSERKRGVPTDKAKRIGYATVVVHKGKKRKGKQ